MNNGPKSVRRVGGVRPNEPRGWSEWTAPKDAIRPFGPGEYQIRATDGHGSPIPVGHRKSKRPDNAGLLYWGETKELSKRFWLLVRSFRNPILKNKHSAAKKYFESASHQTTYPLSGIQLRWRPANLPPKSGSDTSAWPDEGGKDRAVIGEESGLSSFYARFEALPPLNSIRGKRLSGPPVDPNADNSVSEDDLIELGSDPYGELAKVRVKRDGVKS